MSLLTKTFEELVDDDSRTQALLKIASISVMSSFADKPVCLVRKGDTEADCQQLVDDFLSLIEKMSDQFEKNTPEIYFQALDRILDEESRNRSERKQASDKFSSRNQIF